MERPTANKRSSYDDDNDSQLRSAQATLAAEVHGTYHRKKAAISPTEYAAQMMDRFPPVAASSSSSSSSSSEGAEAVGAEFRPGDSSITIDPLDTLHERATIPRSDGYTRKGEPRFGPEWMREFERRQVHLESHPQYRFLEMVAGASFPINRIISVDSMRAARATEEIRSRITAIKSRNLDKRMETLTERYNELRKLEEETIKTRDELSASTKGATIGNLKKEIEANKAELLDLRATTQKYDRLSGVFSGWVQVVNQGADLPSVKQLHAEYMKNLFVRTGQLTYSLVREWLFGTELTPALSLKPLLESLLESLKNKTDGDGNDMLSGYDRTTLGLNLGNFMKKWNVLVINQPGKFVNTRINTSTLPTFADEEINGWLEPQILQQKKELVREDNDMNKIPTEAIDKRLQDIKKTEKYIPMELMSDLNTILDEIQAFRNYDVAVEEYESFLLKFGGVSGANGMSFEIQKDLNYVSEQMQIAEETIKQKKERLDVIEEYARKLVFIRKQKEYVQEDIGKTNQEMTDANEELNSLDVTLHNETFAYRSRPENSGVAHLHPDVSKALSTMYSVVQESMGASAPSLDTLMTDDHWMEPFSSLVGLHLQIKAMMSGRSYTQQALLSQLQLQYETLLREKFTSYSGGSFVHSVVGSASYERDRRYQMLMGIPFK